VSMLERVEHDRMETERIRPSMGEKGFVSGPMYAAYDRELVAKVCVRSMRRGRVDSI